MLALLLMDVILLLQDSPGMGNILAGTRVPALGPDDRAALVTFSRKVKIRKPFTNDRESLNRALGSRLPRLSRGAGNPPQACVFRAIEEAAKLFPPGQGKRAILLLFASEDWSDAAGARPALQSSRAKLYAATVRQFDPARWIDPKTQTPPTIPGPVPPVPTGRAPLPEAAAKTVLDLVKASGGEMTPGKWDLAELWMKATK